MRHVALGYDVFKDTTFLSSFADFGIILRVRLLKSAKNVSKYAKYKCIRHSEPYYLKEFAYLCTKT